ncbi:hypothetical protein ACFDTO_36495 [Microbacteriaceae bacterium 4G12]
MFRVNDHTKADIIEDSVEIMHYDNEQQIAKVRISKKEFMEIADMIKKEMWG